LDSSGIVWRAGVDQKIWWQEKAALHDVKIA